MADFRIDKEGSGWSVQELDDALRDYDQQLSEFRQLPPSLNEIRLEALTREYNRMRDIEQDWRRLYRWTLRLAVWLTVIVIAIVAAGCAPPRTDRYSPPLPGYQRSACNEDFGGCSPWVRTESGQLCRLDLGSPSRAMCWEPGP